MSHEQSERPAAQTTNSPAERSSASRHSAKQPAPITTTRTSAYFWGAASGVALALFAPVLRPAARSAVKGGLRVGRYAKKLAATAKEEFEDIATEAKADLDREAGTEDRA